MKTIEIACDLQTRMSIDEIEPIQGKLKSLSTENYQRLKNEITETGFAFPIYLWKRDNLKPAILGGTQRWMCLHEMRKSEGYLIPPIPVVFIHAKTIQEAKRRILQDVSQYGKVESEGFYEFLDDIGMTLDEVKEKFDIPDFDVDSFEDEYFKDTTPSIDPEIEFSKEIDEQNNYLVFLFRDKEQYLKACEKFSIPQIKFQLSTNDENENMISTGIGRIIDGEKIL